MVNYDWNPQKSYSHGFIWGDGGFRDASKPTCHGELRFSLGMEDIPDLKDVLKSIGDYYYYEYTYKNRKPEPRIIYKRSLGNAPLEKFLVENDYIEKSWKSPTKILSIIPDEFKRYFWQGWIDADGCFMTRKKCKGGAFSFASGIHQDWIDLELLFQKLGIDEYVIRHKTNKRGDQNSEVCMSYGPNIKRLQEYLYPNGYEFGLKRKYDKCMAIINSLPKVSSSYKNIFYVPNTKNYLVYAFGKFLTYMDTEEEAYSVQLSYMSQFPEKKSPNNHRKIWHY